MTEQTRVLPVVYLMGPTASGKTELAVELCQHLPFSVISVDSAMVYRGMDIGTAKPAADILRKVPHRLIDICDPTESYSAGDFRIDALREIESIHALGRIPLLVGGTGLYFRALERGIADLPAADPAVRQQLAEQAASLGWAKMHERLRQLDPAAATRIHPNDPQRIQRALEVYTISGRPISSFFIQTPARAWPGTTLKIIVSPADRGVLHKRIRQRFNDMMEFGLLNEVKAFYQRGDLSETMPSMRTVGYRQVWQHLDGRLGKAEMVEKAVVATRQLAKRQLTWLRSETDARWFDSLAGDFVDKVLGSLVDDPILSQRM